MAAWQGNVAVMNRLMKKGANPNAVAQDIGPVINAAICSGNMEAVRALVEQGVSLTVENEDVRSPLTMAALLSDMSMFEYLVQEYVDRLPPAEFDKAYI